MIRVLLTTAALGAALLQVGAMSSFVSHPAAAPLLPIALLTAWAAVRNPGEVWPALLLVALTLGVASEQRAGWYLLALLPTGALLLAPPGVTWSARLARAPVAAAAGAWVYLALLLGAAGDAEAIPGLAPDLVRAAVGTGALAALLVLLLWPLRARPRGLFA